MAPDLADDGPLLDLDDDNDSSDTETINSYDLLFDNDRSGSQGSQGDPATEKRAIDTIEKEIFGPRGFEYTNFAESISRMEEKRN